MVLEHEDTLKPGTDLFGYRVLEFTGEGTWAYVYKAQHPQLPMLVAIKQLKPEWVQDHDVLQRFLREANIVARLNHTNIVRTYDLRQDERTGSHYIITEFAEKGTLVDSLKAQPNGLSIDDVVHIAMGVCSGLEAIHRIGIVHRDIKPSNILLFDAGADQDTPKLSDFGIARAPAGAGVVVPEKSSGVYGSLLYMSPEQLDEEVTVDHRSDLYSLGILLYELVTGQVPFSGRPDDVFWGHVFGPPTPPGELRSDIPEAVEQIVLRALRKDRDDRYQSAADMHEAFKAIQDISVRRDRQRRFEILLEEGLGHLERGEWDAATKALKQADILEPRRSQVLAGLQEASEKQDLERQYELGVQYLEDKKWEEARDYLVQVISYAPNYRGGQASEQLERATQGLEWERNQRDLLAKYHTGIGHFRGQQWAQAITEFDWVVARDQEFMDAAERLEEAHLYAKAMRQLERAQLHEEQEEWEEALYLLEEVVNLSPPGIDAAEELEIVRRKWAETRVQQRLARWYDEGIARLAAGDLEQAEVCFANIVSYESDYRDVANLLREIGERTKLENLLEQAEAHQAVGDWEQAIGIYREILSVDPYNRAVGRHLTRAQRRAGVQGQSWFDGIALAAQRWWSDHDLRAKIAVMGLLGVIILALCAGTAPTIIELLTPTPTPKPRMLCNGDFEDSFACWQPGGELDQSVKCEESNCYAVLGNPDYACYGGVPVGEAWIKQMVEVPESISPTLLLEYRIFSQDLDCPDCDYLQIAIDGEALPQRHGNYEWSQQSCDRDPWDSDWMTEEIDLWAYRGKEIEISLHNVNGIQPYFNTWTYVDDVRIRPVSKQGMDTLGISR